MANEPCDQLQAALSCAQGQIENALKNSSNPVFRSTYADLASVWDAIRKPLAANGLSVEQHPSADGAKVTVLTILGHSSGQSRSSSLTITAMRQIQGGGWEECANPQAIGSAIHYARRYALSAIVGVTAEDDDGNAATGATIVPRTVEWGPISAAWAPSSKPANVITEPQRSRLYALFGDSGKTEGEVQEILKRNGFARSQDITREKYDAICREISEKTK
jgi:ERF superfamily